MHTIKCYKMQMRINENTEYEYNITLARIFWLVLIHLH